MAKIGRNQPCPCGSGRKTKRCCGVPHGPSADELARVFLNAQAQQWAPLLADYTEDELDRIGEELPVLPRYELSLQLPLPRLLPPALDRIGRAIADDDPESFVAAMPDALDLVDTPTNRQHLARAVLALHDDDHQIGCATTALAILDLATSDRSAVIFSALCHALAVSAGAQPTPSGLLVATRSPAA